MNPLAGLIAPALAVLPGALAGVVGSAAGPVVGPVVGAQLAPVAAEGAEAPDSDLDPLRSFEEAARAMREAPAVQQVRIEQRVIIRISPGVSRGAPVDTRHGLLSAFPPTPRQPRTIERRMAQCLPVSSIAGVQPDGSRLLLFMRDQRIVSARLEKGCSPRDYYSGFLVERTSDGMLCAGRDKLLSRSGANCGMGQLRQIVVLGDDDE